MTLRKEKVSRGVAARFYVSTIYSPQLPWNSSSKDHQTPLCWNSLWKHLFGFKCSSWEPLSLRVCAHIIHTSDYKAGSCTSLPPVSVHVTFLCKSTNYTDYSRWKHLQPWTWYSLEAVYKAERLMALVAMQFWVFFAIADSKVWPGN